MNGKIVLVLTLIVAAFVLAGCTGQPYDPKPTKPPIVNHNSELTDSILLKIEQGSNTFTSEELNFIKNLVASVDTDTTFTSKEVKLILMYFGVLNPQKLLPERTSFSAPIPNVDIAIVTRESNSVEVAFRNNKGVAITLPLTGSVTPQAGTTCNNPILSATYDGVPTAAGTTIPNGGDFILKWDCDDLNPIPAVGDRFNSDLSFQYINQETGQVLTQTGMIAVKYTSGGNTVYVPTSCISSAGLACMDVDVNADSIAFIIRNGLGYGINLESSKMSLENIPCPGSTNAVICQSPDNTCSSSDLGLGDGEGATVVLKGCSIPSSGVRGTIRFNYITNTGLTEVMTVQVSGKP